MEDLLKDKNITPCIFKRDIQVWLTSLNKAKEQMKKRKNELFELESLYSRLRYFDKVLTFYSILLSFNSIFKYFVILQEKQGFLPINTFYQIFSFYKIVFVKNDIEALMKFLGIMVDDTINYVKFLELINNNGPRVDLTSLKGNANNQII